jgi:hypothetical protein
VHPLELGHGDHLPVEREAAAVIAAAQAGELARLGAEDVAAVGADVRHAVQLALRVAREQERFVDAAREQLEGEHRSGPRGALGAVDELPAAREDALAHALEDRGVAIE